MLLLHFDLGDIEKCKSVADVYRMMGIGVKENDPQDLKFDNKEVFGEKANYANLFITEKTDSRIYEHFKSLGNGLCGEWAIYSPVSVGPRFDKLKAFIGELNDSVLYVVEPADEDLYEEYSSGEVDNEQSTSNS